MNIVHLFDQSIDSRSLLQVAIGLRDHPDINASFSDDLYCLGEKIVSKSSDLEKSVQEADLIFRPNDAHFQCKELDNLIKKKDWSKKVAYYDIKDDIAIDEKRLYHCRDYLKRSWTPDMDGIIPLPYCTLPQYYISDQRQRDIDFVYLFPDGMGPTEQSRQAVLEVLKSHNWDGFSRIIGQVTHKGLNGRRLIFDDPEDRYRDYLHILKRTRIIVTCSPDHPGGDSRLWEAMASGALVLTDEPKNIVDQRLENKLHCVFFDEIERIPGQIKVILDNDTLRNRIAKSGYDFVRHHHSPMSRMEQVLTRLK